MDEQTDKKMCSCGMAMDAEGHADMMAADPEAHKPVDAGMPAEGGDMSNEEPAA